MLEELLIALWNNDLMKNLEWPILHRPLKCLQNEHLTRKNKHKIKQVTSVVLFENAQSRNWTNEFFSTKTNFSRSNVAIVASVEFHDSSKWPVTAKWVLVSNKHDVVLLKRRLLSSPLRSRLKGWDVFYKPALPKDIRKILCTTPPALWIDVLLVKVSGRCSWPSSESKKHIGS